MAAVVPCEAGVFDCTYGDANDDEFCAYYNNEYVDMHHKFWIVAVSGVVMCIMAFGIGANDVANAWGTSVGSGAVSLRLAVILGAVGDFMGAVSLGYGVSDTIQKGVSDVTDENCWACGYCDSKMSIFSVGMFGALISAALLLLLATYTALPISATHAVVGAVVGMTFAAVGSDCIDWSLEGLGAIMLSWVVSPLLSGLIGAGLYIVTQKMIFECTSPRSRAIKSVPIFLTTTSWVMTYLVMLKSAVTEHLDEWIHLVVATAAAILVAVLSLIFMVPYIAKRLPSLTVEEVSENKPQVEKPTTSLLDISTVDKSEEEDPSITCNDKEDRFNNRLTGDMNLDSFRSSVNERVGSLDISPENKKEIADALFCFKYLLVFNAFLESFSHGANDTANSTAPFSAVYAVYRHGEDACDEVNSTPLTMVLAGSFVALGVILFGEKVITTVGTKLTKIDFHKGFCIEFSSCVTVVIATVLGLPVSTTHCQVGSVVFVGIASLGYKEVSMKLFGKIVVGWVVTVPLASLMAAAFVTLFKMGL